MGQSAPRANETNLNSRGREHGLRKFVVSEIKSGLKPINTRLTSRYGHPETSAQHAGANGPSPLTKEPKPAMIVAGFLLIGCSFMLAGCANKGTQKLTYWMIGGVIWLITIMLSLTLS
jgi:hypothetical protein